MVEITENGKNKIIAFYLPQYHEIPENNKWWGKGFTEWTNTKKAKPQYEWHYQPKIPLDENYYDLSDVNVMVSQAMLAKQYGIYGFCYYHYWFKNGKQLLERPVNNMLMNQSVDIPFCLSWANENWSRNWDGGNREIIMEQDYGDVKDWENHFIYLLKFFKDSRYITLNGCPILIIYKPNEIPNLREMIKYWRKRCVEEGINGLAVLSQHPTAYFDNTYDRQVLDYMIKFEPAMSRYYAKNYSTEYLRRVTKIKKIIRKSILYKLLYKKKGKTNPTIINYDEAWDIILNKEIYAENIINGAFVDWDNTARNKTGVLYKGGTPRKFETYLTKLLEKKCPLNLVFINAWNEWAEGAYLEPDVKYGYAYLEAIRTALNKREKLK